MLDAGADLRFVQDWLGHSNIQNTIVYTYLTSRNREDSARKVFLRLPRY
jgi:site-specific recombinase XerD